MIQENRTQSAVQSARPAVSTQTVKAVVHRRLLETMDMAQAQRMPLGDLYQECLGRVDVLLNQQRCPMSTAQKEQLVQEVMDEIFGLGPLEEFLRDPAVTDIVANGPYKIYVEREGQMQKSAATFQDDDHLMRVIHRIASRVGRRIDESCPMLDARLTDGSRVNAIIPPLSLEGPALSIRRFGNIRVGIESLVSLQSLTQEMAEFLEACVRSKVNILIVGGTGTGKTTLLNVLAQWVPPNERVVTIEDAAELQLKRDHVVRLETRPANIEGLGQVTQRDLLRNCLRMRPDRIIIGEVRGEETLDMLQAMNTGHQGSMTTVHANTPRDALRRLENMVSMAGINYPVQAIRQQIAGALNLLIHLGRVTGGKRKITCIAEITGMENDAICLQDLFVFRQSGIADGHARGAFEACGARPRLLEHLQSEGFHLPPGMFQHRVLLKVEQ